MKTFFCFFTLFLYIFDLFSFAGYFTSPPEVQKAIDYGADTKVLFRVVDDQGNPVENARVQAAFVLNENENEDDKIQMTGKDGVATLQGKSVGEIVFTISAKQYYDTNGTLNFVDFSRKTELIKDGRWQPYGAVYSYILKPIRNPIPLIAARLYKEVPQTEVPIGYDFLACDFVSPHGKGTTSDMELSFEEVIGKNLWQWKSTLTINFKNPNDGAYIQDRDSYSYFRSCYCANTNAIFKNRLEFSYDSLSTTKPIENLLTSKQYLVLRLRTQVDQNGNVIAAHYAKIYGPLDFFHNLLSFLVYFNPTSNDPNLEYEVGKNLHKSKNQFLKVRLP